MVSRNRFRNSKVTCGTGGEAGRVAGCVVDCVAGCVAPDGDACVVGCTGWSGLRCALRMMSMITPPGWTDALGVGAAFCGIGPMNPASGFAGLAGFAPAVGGGGVGNC